MWVGQPQSDRSGVFRFSQGGNAPVKVWSPPFVLAPQKDKQTELGEMFGDRREKSGILFCAYCLTEDQRWLLASVSNDKGDLLDNCSINIEIPNRCVSGTIHATLVPFARRIVTLFVL